MRALRKLLITGATGNIGFALTRKLLLESDVEVVALLRPGREPYLRAVLSASLGGDQLERLSVVEGDLRRPFCGICAWQGGLVGITDIVHAAADVRWTAPSDDLVAVNVQGTEHLIDLALLLNQTSMIRRVSIVSSAFVAGTMDGQIDEVGRLPADFNSGYEISKFLAERHCKASSQFLPLTIFRPTIVVGSSQTGEIRNFTTIYKPMSMLLGGKLKALPVNPGALLDVVPVDYVADVIWTVHQHQDGEGKIFTIGAGSRAIPVERIWSVMCDSLERATDGARTDSPGRLVRLSPGYRQALLRSLSRFAGQKIATLAAYLPYLTQSRCFSRASLDELHISEPPALEAYAEQLWRYYIACRERGFEVRSTARGEFPSPKSTERSTKGRKHILVIGGTGLLGQEIVRQIAAQGQFPVVLARGKSANADWIRNLADQGLASFVKADITAPDLGLEDIQLHELRRCEHALHLAADYRLSGSAKTLRATNHIGTSNVLAVVERLGVSSLHYVSSITAAGDCEGTVPEAALSKRPRFRNYYEESKWLSEGEVLGWNSTIPRRIYRPGIIIGESSSGRTSKFDGPYPAFRWMFRLIPFPIPRGGRDVVFPLVFVDDVARCIVDGMRLRPVGTEIVHIVDAEAPTLAEYASECRRQLVGRTGLLPVPDILWTAISKLPGLTRMTGLEREALEYMRGMASFDLSAYHALRRSTANPQVIAKPIGPKSMSIADRYSPSILFWRLANGRC